MLFHIIEKQGWVDAQDRGEYHPDGLESEGFIHLSEKRQVLRPANLLYSGRQDLSILVIDPERLTSEVVYEPGSHGESENFPHLYGPLNVDAVISVVDFPCGGDGTFALPAGLPE